jgi:hypothetical protein
MKDDEETIIMDTNLASKVLTASSAVKHWELP